MARKKRSKKKSHHRRRRVGALNVKAAMPVVYSVVGNIAGMLAVKFANTQIAKMTTKIPGVVVGGVEAVGGGILAAKAKNAFMKGLGQGVAAGGAVYALGTNGLAILPAAIGYGPPGPMRPGRSALQGYRDVPAVGFPHPGNVGFPKPGAIAGGDREKARMARMYAGVYG